MKKKKQKTYKVGDEIINIRGDVGIIVCLIGKQYGDGYFVLRFNSVANQYEINIWKTASILRSTGNSFDLISMYHGIVPEGTFKLF